MEIELLSPEMLRECMKVENIYLIDVREWEEYEKSHIDGAVNIPVGMIEDMENCDNSLRKELDNICGQGKKIVLYCKSGNRSMRCARILKECGIECASLYGGLEEFVIDV